MPNKTKSQTVESPRRSSRHKNVVSALELLKGGRKQTTTKKQLQGSPNTPKKTKIGVTDAQKEVRSPKISTVNTRRRNQEQKVAEGEEVGTEKTTRTETEGGKAEKRKATRDKEEPPKKARVTRQSIDEEGTGKDPEVSDTQVSSLGRTTRSTRSRTTTDADGNNTAVTQIKNKPGLTDSGAKDTTESAQNKNTNKDASKVSTMQTRASRSKPEGLEVSKNATAKQASKLQKKPDASEQLQETETANTSKQYQENDIWDLQDAEAFILACENKMLKQQKQESASDTPDLSRQPRRPAEQVSPRQSESSASQSSPKEPGPGQKSSKQPQSSIRTRSTRKAETDVQQVIKVLNQQGTDREQAKSKDASETPDVSPRKKTRLVEVFQDCDGGMVRRLMELPVPGQEGEEEEEEHRGKKTMVSLLPTKKGSSTSKEQLEAAVQSISTETNEVEMGHTLSLAEDTNISEPNTLALEIVADPNAQEDEGTKSYTFKLSVNEDDPDKLRVQLVGEKGSNTDVELVPVESGHLLKVPDKQPVQVQILSDDKEVELLKKSLEPQDNMENYYTLTKPKGNSDTSASMYSCKQCNAFCATEKSFTEHWKLHGQPFEPWHCALCQFKCAEKSTMIHHVNQHKGLKRGIYQCNLCAKRFNYKQKLAVHMNQHDEDKDYNCSFCQLSFNGATALRAHVVRKHPNKFISLPEDVKTIHISKETEEPTRKLPARRIKSHAFFSTKDIRKRKGRNSDDISVDIPLADGTLKTITTTPDGGFVSFDEQLPKNAVPVNEEKTRTPKGKMTPQKKIETLILKLEKSDPGFLDYCSVSFEDRYNLKTQFSCNSCVYHCPSKQKMIEHLLEKHKDARPFKCEMCPYDTRHRSSLHQHRKTHFEDRPHKCEVCNKSFRLKNTLVRHMNCHNNERNFACGYCERSFNNKDDVQKHIKRVHTSYEEADIVCDICMKMFKVVSDLNRHKRTHNASKDLPCPYCGKYYKSQESLAVHMRSHTTEYYCQICDKQIGSHSAFLAHKKLHEPDFVGYTCQECGKVLQSKGSLHTHIKTIHSDERPFVCPECSKAFKLKIHLDRHMRNHNQYKPYVCTLCGFSCKRKESLLVHSRVHNEKKPFECTICKKGYTQKHALESHIQMQHDDSQYECGLCGTIFRALFQLQRHIKRVHVEHTTDETTVLEKTGETTEDASTGSESTSTAEVLQSDEGTVLVCEQCHEAFTSQHALAVHILTTHMDQKWAGSVGLMVTQSGEQTLVAVNPEEAEQEADGATQEVVETVEISMDDEMVVVSQDPEGGVVQGGIATEGVIAQEEMAHDEGTGEAGTDPQASEKKHSETNERIVMVENAETEGVSFVHLKEIDGIEEEQANMIEQIQ